MSHKSAHISLPGCKIKDRKVCVDSSVAGNSAPPRKNIALGPKSSLTPYCIDERYSDI